MKKIYRFVGKEELEKILSSDERTIKDSGIWKKSFTLSKGISFFENLRVPLIKDKIILTNNETGEQTIKETQISKEKLPIIFFTGCFGQYLVEYEVDEIFFNENFKRCAGYYDCAQILVEELFIEKEYNAFDVIPVRICNTFLEFSNDTLLTTLEKCETIDEIIEYLDYDASWLESDYSDAWEELYEEDDFDDEELDDDEIFA